MDKLLKGAKVSELPIEQPTKFNLAINLESAKMLPASEGSKRACALLQRRPLFCFRAM